MVFTDIQSSTALWAHAPQHMGNALDSHHEVIRELIAKHAGYEVKTIGDSFMVAFKDSRKAVQFAIDVQRALYSYDWGTDLFDGAYIEQLLEAGIDAIQPESVWSGLRVRVGVHSGTGDIKVDVATGGYDYYGTVVNTAARVEAVGHGGQVLITEECLEGAGGMEEIGDAATTNGGTLGLRSFLTNLGGQPLRGLENPVKLWQLVPEEFRERHFPPLRLDKDGHFDEDEDDTDESVTSQSKNTYKTLNDRLSMESGNSAGQSVVSKRKENTNSCSSATVRNLDTATSRATRRLRLNTSAAGLAFAYRLMDTMLSTSTVKTRSAFVTDAAKQWRVPSPLPKWANFTAADLSNGRMRNLSVGNISSLNAMPPQKSVKALKTENRVASQLLFTVARVIGTLEALPSWSRPEWVGSKGGPATDLAIPSITEFPAFRIGSVADSNGGDGDGGVFNGLSKPSNRLNEAKVAFIPDFTPKSSNKF